MDFFIDRSLLFKLTSARSCIPLLISFRVLFVIFTFRGFTRWWKIVHIMIFFSIFNSRDVEKKKWSRNAIKWSDIRAVRRSIQLRDLSLPMSRYRYTYIFPYPHLIFKNLMFFNYKNVCWLQYWPMRLYGVRESTRGRFFLFGVYVQFISRKFLSA